MPRMVRRYSPEFKQEALALVTPDRSIVEVASELGMSAKTLGKWVRAERTHTDLAELTAAGPIDPAVHRAALQRIAELERENEFLGKVSAFFASKPRG